jgi:hypothetical protein
VRADGVHHLCSRNSVTASVFQKINIFQGVFCSGFDFADAGNLFDASNHLDLTHFDCMQADSSILIPHKFLPFFLTHNASNRDRQAGLFGNPTFSSKSAMFNEQQELSFM